jgi:hypothetical protein
MANGLAILLETAFRPKELVAIGEVTRKTDGDYAWPSGATLSRERWLERLQKKSINQIYSGRDGVGIRINPMKPGTDHDAGVTGFRHVLVEWDTGSKLEQFSNLVQSGLPITAVIDSGNKSIHGWIRVDAPTIEEYKRRRQLIWNYFKVQHIDAKNQNPSRYSRCPEVVRDVYEEKTGKFICSCRQELLAINLGAADWQSWEKCTTTVSGRSG